MAYQVLARKYRPQRFADVAGQDHVTVTLMNALRQQRIAHGYIFSGHRGIGKTTIARILAMALNCRNVIGSEVRPTAEPCEVCESCTEIRAGNAVDVIEIDAATNRGIDEIRELRDAARYRPARDKYKIYILDEAHQITDAAFNALLKTLEEPPEHIVFMMATTQPEDIPQTVRSRCQHFNFHAVKMVDILTELRGIAAREGVEADDAALSLLAEAGDGSMRDALSVMDQAIASAPVLAGGDGGAGRAVLSAAQIRELMGTVSNAVFERLFEAVDGGRSAEVIRLANELMDAGNSASQLARQCVRFLRNVLMAKVAGLTAETAGEDGVATEILQISPDERRRAARTAGMFTEEELTRYMQVMLRTFDELGYRQEQRFHFELGLLKLVHLRRLLPMEELLSQLPVGGAGGAARPSAGLAGGPAKVVAERRVAADVVRAEARSPVEPPAGGAGKPAFSPFAADSQRKRFGVEGEVAAAASAAMAAPRPSVTTPVPVAGKAVQEKPEDREPLRPSKQPELQNADGGGAASESGRAEVAERSSELAIEAPARLEAQSTESSGRQAEAPLAAGRPFGAERSEQVVGMPMHPALEPTPPAKNGWGVTETAPGEGLTDGLRQAALDALLRSGKQVSAGEALEDAEWRMEDGVLRVQTSFSKAMLAMVLNPDAEKIARAAILQANGDAGGGALKIVWLAGVAAEKKLPATKRAARSGTAQAKAEEHPIVRQAQELFQAEIRKVIDLSGK